MTRKMKDSGIEWIGEIPEDWQTIRVKNLFDVSRGRVISKLEITDDGKYPVYSSQTENDGIFGYIDTFDYSGEALTWTTDGEKAGTVFYRNGKYNCTNICGILQKKQDSIYKTDIKYLFYAIRMVAEENKRPDTNGHKIMSNEMERLSIPITNYDEQVKIGLTLDEKSRNIDNTLNLIKEEIESLENYKKSVITEAVTKGLDKNVEMKDSGIEWIGEIPKHWNMLRIKNLGICRNGLTYSPSDTCDEKDGTLVLRSSNVQNGKIVLNNNVYVKKRIPDYLMVKNGDILICSRNGSKELIGKNAIINNIDATFGAFMMIYRSKNPKLMYYVLNSNIFQYYLGTFFTSTINQLTNSNFENMKIVWCDDINEQDQLVDYLDKKTKLIDDSIATKQKQLETLEEYKKSLIYEYVTGKKEVKDGEET